MKKKAAKPRIYIELTAVWGNDDADSSIKVSRRRWKAIQEGTEYGTSGWGWYEGSRFPVVWSFSDGKVSVYGPDCLDCVIDHPVEKLIVGEVK